MKKLFYVTIFCSLVLPRIAHAEETDTIAKTDSAFFHAIYQKDISYAADSDSIISEKRQLILIADTILNNKDSIGIILEDTSLFQLGLKRDTFVFCLKNINVVHWDTIDSPIVAIRYIQQESCDTLLCSLPLFIKENKSYSPQPTLIQTLFSPKWMWWTIGGICVIVLLIAGGIVLFFWLKKKKEKDPKPIEHSGENDNQIGNPIDDENSNNGNNDDIDITDIGSDNKEIKRLKGIIETLKSEKALHNKAIEDIKVDAQKTLNEAQKAWDKEKESIQKAEQEKLAKKDNEIAGVKNDYQKQLDRKIKISIISKTN